MIVSVNLCRLITETSCFTDKRNDGTTHPLKSSQAFITTDVSVGTVKKTTTADTSQLIKFNTKLAKISLACLFVFLSPLPISQRVFKKCFINS